MIDIIVTPWDPADGDIALAAALARHETELLELALLESSAMGKIMEYALLAEVTE